MLPSVSPGAADVTETSPRPEQVHALPTLRRFARARPPVERCELCSIELGLEHQHLLNRDSRQLTCSCDACAILFCGQEGTKFLRIPRRIMRIEGFSFTDEQWDAMMLPINLTFFLRRPNGNTVAMYPSPAGIMESLIELPDWTALFAGEAALLAAEPEVEALLVNRIGDRAAYYTVPIDACYRLVGLIRTKWRGFSGGAAVWEAIADFFTDLEQRATRIQEPSHA